MNYSIFVNNQLFKTVTTSDGYNYVDIVKEVIAAKDRGELAAFGVDTEMAIRVEQQ
jgi:hypothetical protein